MKYNFNFIVIAILIVMNFILTKKLFEKKIDSKKEKLNLPIVQDSSTHNIPFLTNGSKLKTEGYLESHNTQQIDPLSIYHNKPILILRLHEDQCLDCFLPMIDKWNQMYNKTEHMDMMIMTNFTNPNDYELFIQSKKIQGTIYNTRNVKIKSLLESQENPYIFILSKNDQILDPFIITKSTLSNFDLYSKYLASKYFKPNEF